LSDPGPILLYDGHCRLCNGWVRFLLRVDPTGPLRFAPLGGETARRLLAPHPGLERVDSVVLVEAGRVSVRSTAVLRICRYLGGLWRVLLIGYLVPRAIRDSLYDVVAHWRYRLVGRYDACPIPPPAVRSRFLD
jgi:predicted DCC family thiol-disulfide oxidoreductase YuxK